MLKGWKYHWVLSREKLFKIYRWVLPDDNQLNTWRQMNWLSGFLYVWY